MDFIATKWKFSAQPFKNMMPYEFKTRKSKLETPSVVLADIYIFWLDTVYRITIRQLK